MKHVLIGIAATLLFCPAAFAVPFGPATAALGSFDVPTITLGATSGTVKLNGGTDQLNAGTGSLSSTPYTGSGAGTFSFSFTPAVTISNPITSLFVFNDQAGGTYVFNLNSVDTVSFANTPGGNTSIILYLLGTFGDANLSLSATPTSLILNLNQTGSSNFSESGTLSNPPVPPPVAVTPAPVPEPASITLLGMGITALATMRARNRR